MTTGVIGAVALMATVVTAVVGLGTTDDPAPPGCPDQPTTLAVAPEAADPVGAALAASGCATLDVEPAASATVAAAVARGDGPDFWIPESRAWVHDKGVEVLVPSVAASPLVVAGGRAPDRWQDVITHPRVMLGDPASEPVATLAVAAAQRGLPERSSVRALAPLAQRAVDSPGPVSLVERLREVGRHHGITVASERSVLAEAPDTRLSVPGHRTAFLDYPLLGTGPHSEATTTWLRDRLTSTSARARFVEAGFRTSLTSDVTAPEHGVGSVKPVEVTHREIAAARQRWSLLAVPTRGLAVVDVSGSMDFETGRGTRMELTVAAARNALRLFPGSSELGLWVFSERLSDRHDHRELLPIDALGDWVGADGTHADALDTALARLPRLTGGGTGLYDTTLAAFRAVRRDHRPDMLNSVLVLTDGANDDPGSITLRRLVARLERMSGETPVRIITIGISRDADARALRAIADATGGASYVADDPTDIESVFLDALTDRARAE